MSLLFLGLKDLLDSMSFVKVIIVLVPHWLVSIFYILGQLQVV